MSKKIKQISILLVTATVFFALGIIISPGNTIFDNVDNSIVSECGSYQAGWDDAEKRLTETGFSTMLAENVEIFSVSGEIKEIKNGKITLDAYPLGPLADPELDTRIIEVADAKIYKLIEKDQEEFQKEMEAFDKQMRDQIEDPEVMIDPTLSLALPEMFIKQEIKLSDLEIGQQIMIEAEEDIKEAKEFKAKSITLQFTPVMPGAMGEEMLLPMEGDPLME